MPLINKRTLFFQIFAIISLSFGGKHLITFLTTTSDVQAKILESRITYETTFGMGLDKWSSAWLLSRHVSPGAQISVLQNTNQLSINSIKFDLQGYELSRSRDLSTFEVILEKYTIQNPIIERLAKIINDIEVNLWRPNSQIESGFIEVGFRHLQRRYPSGDVPLICYMAFFDNVSDFISGQSNFDSPEALAPEENCQSHAISKILTQVKEVPEISANEMIDLIKRKKRILFIDVRENFEFVEAHIPGSLNFPIKNLGDSESTIFEGYDLIVPYCVKDFRGYEMARLLQKKGYDNTAIMNPYGFKGWTDSGFPIYKNGINTEASALAELVQCAQTNCIR